MLKAPNPRYRLYTQYSTYFSFFRDIFTKRVNVGNDVEVLERKLCEKLGVAHAVCVPQNRVGVYLTIKHLIKPGQNVVMSPYTIADIINMVICAGGRPVFADVERETCNINPAEIEKLIDENTGAVLITHLHGLAMPGTARIAELCAAKGIPMLEDSAQAFGTIEAGRRIGTIGHAGIYSFGMFKNLVSWFGGAVVSNDKKLIDSIRADLETFEYQTVPFIMKKVKKGLLTDVVTWPPLFKALTFWIFRYGYLNDVEAINKRVRTELDVSPKEKIPADYLRRYTPAQARLVLTQLDNVDAHSKVRIANALEYYEGLKDIKDLVIPPARDDFSHIYTYFPIQYAKRTELIKHIMRHGGDVAAQHYKNTADLPGFSRFHRDCPNSRAVSEQLIFLPTYPDYGIENVRRNIRVIRSYFEKVRLLEPHPNKGTEELTRRAAGA